MRVKSCILLLAVILISLGCAHNKIRFVHVGKHDNSTKEIIAATTPTEFKCKNDLLSSVPVSSINVIDLSEAAKTQEFTKTELITIYKKSANKRIHKTDALISKTLKPSEYELVQNVKKDWIIIPALFVLLGFGSILLTRAFRNAGFKLSTWGFKNKNAARVAVVGAQLGLGFSGVAAGRTLAEMNVQLDETTHFLTSILGSIIFIAMLGKEYFFRQPGFMANSNSRAIGIALMSGSLFASTVGIGNGLSSDKLLMAPITSLTESTAPDNDPDIITLMDGRILENSAISEDDRSIQHQNCGEKTGPKLTIPLNSINNIQFAETSNSFNADAIDSKGPNGGVLALWIILGLILTGALILLSCMAICAWGGAGLLVAAASLALIILFNFGMSNWYFGKR